MSTRSRIGVSLGVASIVFSSLCLVVMPVFTAAILAALLIGAAFSAIAASLGAPRTAGVTLVFSLAPLFGFLVLENLTEHFGTGYVAFAPWVAATGVAAFVAINYVRDKHAR